MVRLHQRLLQADWSQDSPFCAGTVTLIVCLWHSPRYRELYVTATARTVSWAWASLPPSFFTCRLKWIHARINGCTIFSNHSEVSINLESIQPFSQRQSALHTSTITSKSVPNTGLACLIDSCRCPGSGLSLVDSVTQRPAFSYTSLSFLEPVEKLLIHDKYTYAQDWTDQEERSSFRVHQCPLQLTLWVFVVSSDIFSAVAIDTFGADVSPHSPVILFDL